jgi:hypothetical protein
VGRLPRRGHGLVGSRPVHRPGGGHVFFQSDSTLDDQGGFINTSTGGYLSTGGTWTNASDREAKEGFAPVDGQEVLARVAELPITIWSYRAEGSSVRHIGPTGQDFRAAFGLGADERHIGTVDADGVALAAIQGLNEVVAEQDAKIAALQEQIAGLSAPARPAGSVGSILLIILSSLALLVGAGLGWGLARRRGTAG